jgi:Zn-dependent protease with chaperone function
MIALFLTLLGLVLVVLPGLSGQPQRLPAAEWALVAGVALLLGFATFETGLMLLGLPTLLRVLHAAGFAEICEQVLRPLSPGGDLAGWTAIVLALVVGARAWRTTKRAIKSAVAVEAEPWLGRHEDRGDFELVVLPTDQLLAVSAPAGRPQVLISDGLVERLDAQQLEAVIRHEATHLRCGHWRFTLLATVVERALSPLTLVERSTRALRNALEAWADETAAGESTAERAVVPDAIVAVCGTS